MTGATATIAGNLTADPTLRYTQNGHAVADFTVAQTPRRFNVSTGQWEDFGETLFMRCSAWRQLGENVAGLHKGDAVIVTGELEQRTFIDKDNNERRVIELRAEVVGPDLRTQAVTGVMRIRKGGMPDKRSDDQAWSPEPVSDDASAPASRRREPVPA